MIAWQTHASGKQRRPELKGNQMARLLALIATSLVLILGCAATASATPYDDASAVGVQFAAAATGNTTADYTTACSLMSSSFLALYGGSVASCVQMIQKSAAESMDETAKTSLRLAYIDATFLAMGNKKSAWITKRCRVKCLRKRLAKLDHDLKFRVGKKYRDAASASAMTVYISKRTTARHLVLFAHSDSGSIFVLRANRNGNEKVGKTSVKGKVVAQAPSPAPEVIADAVTLSADSSTAFVALTVTVGGDSEPTVLEEVLENGQFRVNDILISVRWLATAFEEVGLSTS
jgi:hypothetical protein